MAQNRTYRNYLLVSKHSGKAFNLYYGRKSGKGEKANIPLELNKYNPATQRHEKFVEGKITWRSN